MPITLREHNKEPYEKTTEHFKTSNRAVLIHPTGTGKSYIGLKIAEDNKEKNILWIAPYVSILHQVKKNIFNEGMTMSDFPNLDRMTYSKLGRMSEKELKQLKYDIFVIDEFHHTGAEKWGKAIEKILENNKDAKVLGMSATGIRYLEKRNMADEMFDGNVISEMSLKEAIDQEILPSVTYVATLYGDMEDLDGLEEKIKNNPNKGERNKLKEQLEELHEKIDENTKNLPNVLQEYMENKNGKYMVFCKNLEDMQEKVESAQKMFGSVNSNIKTYQVSSRIKNNDKILNQFENDNDPEALKLLFSVDMVNEGYHPKNLDGAIMMRPTESLNLFIQQIGRPLNAGGKDTVIIDLVNNYSHCKVIEEFVKKEFGNSKNEKEKADKKCHFTVIDNTKDFRKIVEKFEGNIKTRTFFTKEEKMAIIRETLKDGKGNWLREEQKYPVKFLVDKYIKQIDAGTSDLTNEEIQEFRQLAGPYMLYCCGKLKVDGERRKQIAIRKVQIENDITEQEERTRNNLYELDRLDKNDPNRESIINQIATDNMEIARQLVDKMEFDLPEEYLDDMAVFPLMNAINAEKHKGNFITEIGKKINEYYYENYNYNRSLNGVEKIINKYKKTYEQFLNSYGIEPSDYEMADWLEEPIDKIRDIKNIIHQGANNPELMDDMSEIDGKQGISTGQVHELDEIIDRFDDKNYANAMLNAIPEKERDVIKRRFGMIEGGDSKNIDDYGWTLKQIGELYGVHQEAIRQRESRALQKLRHPSRTKINPYKKEKSFEERYKKENELKKLQDEDAKLDETLEKAKQLEKMQNEKNGTTQADE